MKKFLFLLITITAAAILLQCKQDATAFSKEVGMKLCKKMSSCMQEKMASIPEAQREMVKGMIPDCDKEMAKQEAKSDKKAIALSSSEMALGKTCVEKLDKTACNDMEKAQISECSQFAEVMSAKEKAGK